MFFFLKLLPFLLHELFFVLHEVFEIGILLLLLDESPELIVEYLFLFFVLNLLHQLSEHRFFIQDLLIPFTVFILDRLGLIIHRLLANSRAFEPNSWLRSRKKFKRINLWYLFRVLDCEIEGKRVIRLLCGR